MYYDGYLVYLNSLKIAGLFKGKYLEKLWDLFFNLICKTHHMPAQPN